MEVEKNKYYIISRYHKININSKIKAINKIKDYLFIY